MSTTTEWNLDLHLPGCKLSPGKVDVCKRAESTKQTEYDRHEGVETQGPRVIQAVCHGDTAANLGGVAYDGGTLWECWLSPRTFWPLCCFWSRDTRSMAGYWYGMNVILDLGLVFSEWPRGLFYNSLGSPRGLCRFDNGREIISAIDLP